MADFSWIGGIVQAGAQVYGTIKAGKDQKDLMNKQAEMNATSYAYNLQKMKEIEKIVLIIGVVGFVIALLFVLKKK